MFGFLILQQEQNDINGSSISNRKNLIYSSYATDSSEATTAGNQQQMPTTAGNTSHRRDLNSCREGSNSRDSSNRRDSRDKTTAVRVQQRRPAAAQETTSTSGDANKSRDARTGGNTSRLRKLKLW
jgi:hypothetical protein